MAWLGAIILVIGFIAIAKALGMVGTARAVLSESQAALKVVRDKTLSDADKESAMQSAARCFFRHFVSLSIAGAVALLIPVGAIWLGDLIGFFNFTAVINTTLSPTFLIVSTIAILAVMLRAPRASARTDDDNYSATDKLLHRIAFRTTTAQLGVADIEDRLFAKQLKKFPVERPVFVTGLPRAGTTLLLECLARMPEFASHTYRDMPFVLTPMLWARFARVFKRAGNQQERAHGDGMQIDFDSPEALEEVLWMAFWDRPYQSDRIIPWSDKRDAEFETFFNVHMRKIVALRRPNNTSGVRYVSKNNLNIARLPLLRTMFPDATIIVPFRKPLEHAASLLQQHLHFSALHQRDAFAADYMRGLGHFDFGRHLRPVDFNGWLDDIDVQPDTLEFWLQYWMATYQHLIERPCGAHFFCYEALCQHPSQMLTGLVHTLRCRDAHALRSAASTIRAPRRRDIDTTNIPDALLEEATALYDRLADRHQSDPSAQAVSRQPAVSVP